MEKCTILEQLVKALNLTNTSEVIDQYIDELKVSGRKALTGKIKCIDKAEKFLVSITQI